MVVIIPAAGRGTRFLEAGYTLPKPLISARGVPMIRRVADMAPSGTRIIAIVRPDIAKEVRSLGLETVEIKYPQQGAALSILCANGHVEDDEEVLIVNSDNIFNYDMEKFLSQAYGTDGCLLTFEVAGGPWSYVKADGLNVKKVVEKKQISNLATAGAYYFGGWALLRAAIAHAIVRWDTYNNEIYLAPCYNYLIEDPELVVEHHQMPAKAFISLGTPEALERYNNHA